MNTLKMDSGHLGMSRCADGHRALERTLFESFLGLSGLIA